MTEALPESSVLGKVTATVGEKVNMNKMVDFFKTNFVSLLLQLLYSATVTWSINLPVLYIILSFQPD